jgi:AraC-like DNA-binding protein
MQTYRERRPAPELDDLIACLWVQQVAADGAAYEHRTVPNGSIEIVHVAGPVGGAALIGPRRHAGVERLAPGSTVVGARLRPGVNAAIVGAAAYELVDVVADLEAVWGRRAVARLAEAATSPEAIARALERELAARRAVAPDLDPVVAAAVHRLQPWQRAGVDELAADLFISPRQLRRRCISALGFGPKRLQRMLRFQGFLALAHRRDVELGWLAVAAGYFDQAHLTRECVALTGLTPAPFLAEMRAGCGANHDHAASFAVLRRALLTSRS